MLDQQKEAFREEARELLIDLEHALLELEGAPDDSELVGKVFRAMHTIKGSGAMFGFEAVSAFTHEVETVYDRVRAGQIAVSPELVSLSLAARDHIQTMLETPDAVPEERTRELVAGFQRWLPQSREGGIPAPSHVSEEERPPITCRIRFRPDPDLFRRGTNPLSLLNELRELGRCRVVAQTDALPFLPDFDPEACYTYWDIILTTARGLDAVRDVFIFVEDDCEVKIDVIDDGNELQNDEVKRIGDILVERGDVAQSAIDAVVKSRKLLGEILIEHRLVSPDKVESALAEQEQLREVRQERDTSGSGRNEAVSSLRVPAEKLDALVDLVGELVTIQSRLSQTAAGRDDGELTAIAEEVERLTAELRDQTLNIRMLPIGTTFSKFKRLVRDLARDLGKEIEMKTSGAETELDKTVIEKLNDPLVHIIRNSIDHGIETPEARRAVGKAPRGTIHLSAVHSGDSVVIEIADDGKGLDQEAIRRKGVQRGLIAEHDELAPGELFQLIFAPGFSTAGKVTNVSGRGVGMDVVKRAIEALRGTIELTSRPDLGTTIRIKIPLTLAIIESLLVRIGDGSFVLPLAQVEECIELTGRDIARAHGRHLARVRDQLVPYIPLRERFAIEGPLPSIQQVVITRCNGQRVGLVVDHVIGEHQTVIKTLGRMYREAQGLSGATILGDGTVALILDIAQLVRDAEAEEKVAACG